MRACRADVDWESLSAVRYQECSQVIGCRALGHGRDLALHEFAGHQVICQVDRMTAVKLWQSRHGLCCEEDVVRLTDGGECCRGD